VTAGVNNITQSAGLGSVLPPVASPTSGNPASNTSSAATTTTTAPGLLGGLGNAANTLSGGG
jgi:hypothetical protein